MKNIGEKFLHQKKSKLHISKEVDFEQKRKRIKGEKTSQKPEVKIKDWLKILEKTHLGHRGDSEVLERIKNYYFKKHVIKPKNVPESVFLLEQKIARDQGYGYIEITDAFRKEKTEQLIRNQKSSLKKWLTYLLSADADYPFWAKYWVFTSVVKMGKLEKVKVKLKEKDKETGEKKEVEKEILKFRKRRKDTVASFPVLNSRALAETISAVRNNLKEKLKPKKDRDLDNLSKKLSDREFKQLVSSEDFSKIYAQFLLEMPEYSTEGLEEIRGKWVKYKQGSDPKKLVDSLEGYPLEWCTADYDTAKNQLERGDFHVYYSYNEKQEAKIPRVAIRMQGNKISEVRGIAPEQNTDSYIGDVVDEKMSEFPDGEEYKQKAADMKKLTKIKRAHNQGKDLTKKDLRFLYEIDRKINNFGYNTDPRIKEIISGRNIKEDLVWVLNCKKEGISLSKQEALKGNIKFHYGDLFLNNLTTSEGLELPGIISGTLSFYGLKIATGLKLPETITGSLYLSGLKAAKGLEFPEIIDGSLDLRSLETAKGLKFPKIINGDFDLRSLKIAKGLEFPETINGNFDLNSLEIAEGLKLPKTINGIVDLSSLKTAKGLELPEIINEHLSLSGLKTAEGLKLPETINGGLYLSCLTISKGLELPKTVNGGVYLHNLKTSEKEKLREKYPHLTIL